MAKYDHLIPQIAEKFVKGINPIAQQVKPVTIIKPQYVDIIPENEYKVARLIILGENREILPPQKIDLISRALNYSSDLWNVVPQLTRKELIARTRKTEKDIFQIMLDIQEENLMEIATNISRRARGL